MEKSSPPVIRCPTCGRSNPMPADGARFTCMFCGRIAGPAELHRLAGGPAVPGAALYPVIAEAAIPSEAPPKWSEEPASFPAWKRSFRWSATRRDVYTLQTVVVCILLFLAILVVAPTLAPAHAALAAGLLVVGIVCIVALLLMSLPGALNSSTLRLIKGWLQVHTGPLPRSHTHNLLARDIHSLEVGLNTARPAERSAAWPPGAAKGYHLTAHMVTGQSVVLLERFKDRALLDQAAAELGRLLEL